MTALAAQSLDYRRVHKVGYGETQQIGIQAEVVEGVSHSDQCAGQVKELKELQPNRTSYTRTPQVESKLACMLFLTNSKIYVTCQTDARSVQFGGTP